MPKSKNDREIEREVDGVDGDSYGLVEFYPSYAIDKKRWDRFVKAVESIIRRCLEYKDYVTYLRDEVDLDEDIFLSKVTSQDVRIEIHHSPLTLYEITDAVANQFIRKNEKPFSSFTIANEVIRLHYKDMVGVVPLSKTVHDLVHSGKVLIPISAVHGNVREFVKQYHRDMNRDTLKKLECALLRRKEDIMEINKILKLDIRYNPSRTLEEFVSEISGLLPMGDETDISPEHSDNIPF